MLWDTILQFYVQYVFGGLAPDNEYYKAFLGEDYDGNYNYLESTYIKSPFISSNGNELLINIGNYLSFIATIITMVALLLFCIFLIKKIIGVIFRLFNFGV